MYIKLVYNVFLFLKVVMLQVIYLYFDLLFEFDLEEFGFYWVLWFIDIMKIFQFFLDRLYENIDVNWFGELLINIDVCG